MAFNDASLNIVSQAVADLQSLVELRQRGKVGVQDNTIVQLSPAAVQAIKDDAKAQANALITTVRNQVQTWGQIP